MKIKHEYGYGSDGSEHEFEVTKKKNRIIEKKEETFNSLAAKWEAETCPAHGHGNCHFMCCGQCRMTGKPIYEKDWSKYQATLKTVKYREEYVICPLCKKEIIVSSTEIIE